MKSETIKAIFTNLLFVIGVIFVIFGFIQGTLTAVRLITFDQYPLQSYEETRCEAPFFSAVAPMEGQTPPSAVDIQAQQERCRITLDRDRRVKKTEDLVTAITTLVSGAVLVYSFRRFIFK